MAQTSSNAISTLVKTGDKPVKPKVMYFVNEKVEYALTKYIWSGCTDVALRDMVMSNASELIRQVIKKQGLAEIYPGKEESSLGDLHQIAWCVCPNTIIITKSGIQPMYEMFCPSIYHISGGGVVPISDSQRNGEEPVVCPGKAVDVFGYHGLKSTTDFYLNLHNQPVRKVTSKYGYNLTCSLDHPHRVLTKSGIKSIPTKKLKIGDLVGVQYNQQCFGNQDDINFVPKTTGGTTKDWNPPTKWTPDLAYIVGLLISEGSLEKYRTVIYNADQAVIDRLQNNSVGLEFKYDASNISSTTHCRRFAEFLEYIGLHQGMHSSTKMIPQCMLKCSKEIIVEMLRGMFDGDGHSNKNIGVVGYSSSSPELIEVLRVLLLNFGIVSKTSYSERGLCPNPKGGMSERLPEYQLLLSSEDSAKFYQSIGFGIPYKQVKAKSLTSQPWSLIDKITTKHLQDVLRDVSPATIRRVTGFKKRNLVKGKQMRLNTFAHVVITLELNQTDRFLANRLSEYIGNTDDSSKMIWLPVEDIEERENQLVVDIEVPDSGTFTANGIVTSNCQIERVLYKFRSYPHCRVCFNPDRPPDSLLYCQDDNEYGIVMIEELLENGISKCPNCGAVLSNDYCIEPETGIYGGSPTVLYRGPSKLFNMWCVSPETMLLTSNGIDTIGDVVSCSDAYPPKVYGPCGLQPVNGVLSKPETATRIIKTLLGYEIECSPEHGLYKLENGIPTRVEADTLKAGDLLGIQFNQQLFQNLDSLKDLPKYDTWNRPDLMTDELAYIVGLFVAEGSYSYGKLVIYNIDRDVIDTLVKNTLGLNFIHEPQFQRVSLCNVEFIDFMIKFGFPERTEATTKMIPRRMLLCSRELIAACLRGMFDGDGHSIKHNGCVGYTSTSKKLTAQVRMLLLNFGILTKISYDKRKIRKFIKKKTGRMYVSKLAEAAQLLLSASDSKRFYEKIGFGIDRKAVNADGLTENNKEFHYCFNDHFRALYARYGCGSLGYDSIRRAIRTNHCTVKSAIAALKSWSEHETDADVVAIKQRIDEITRSQNNIKWLPIKSIKDGSSKLVEISIDHESHAYIANGIWSSNSQISKTVILAHIKKDSRDRVKKGFSIYRSHLRHKSARKHRSNITDKSVIEQFVEDVRLAVKHDSRFDQLPDCLLALAMNDSNPYMNITNKLTDLSGLPRQTIKSFMMTIKNMSGSFVLPTEISKMPSWMTEHQHQENEDAE